MAKRRASSATFLATSVAVIGFSSYTLAFSVGVTPFQKHSSGSVPCARTSTSSCCPTAITGSNQFLQQRRHIYLLHATNPTDEDDKGTTQATTPLCDLQTFLRMTDLVDSGGAAKIAIQSSKCLLNGNVETRRSKKLFPGDKVTFGGSNDLDVSTEVNSRGYVYKRKLKKVKPLAKVIDADGNLEFGGRFRSEEWRAERKAKKAIGNKANRKLKNHEESE